MSRILIDLNVLFDCYDSNRADEFPESIQALDSLKQNTQVTLLVSSSSLDNLHFVKSSAIRREWKTLTKAKAKAGYLASKFVQEVLSFCGIAKTPSYIEIDYEDIEGSQVLLRQRLWMRSY